MLNYSHDRRSLDGKKLLDAIHWPWLQLADDLKSTPWLKAPALCNPTTAWHNQLESWDCPSPPTPLSSARLVILPPTLRLAPTPHFCFVLFLFFIFLLSPVSFSSGFIPHVFIYWNATLYSRQSWCPTVQQHARVSRVPLTCCAFNIRCSYTHTASSMSCWVGRIREREREHGQMVDYISCRRCRFSQVV